MAVRDVRLSSAPATAGTRPPRPDRSRATRRRDATAAAFRGEAGRGSTRRATPARPRTSRPRPRSSWWRWAGFQRASRRTRCSGPPGGRARVCSVRQHLAGALVGRGGSGRAGPGGCAAGPGGEGLLRARRGPGASSAASTPFVEPRPVRAPGLQVVAASPASRFRTTRTMLVGSRAYSASWWVTADQSYGGARTSAGPRPGTR